METTAMIAGIDFSTRAIDVVLLDEDSDAATWHRFELYGQDAFDRTRNVSVVLPNRLSTFWDDVLAVGLEQPRGNHGVVHMARIQGAILSCIPSDKLVHPLNPASWRKTVGLPGNASKGHVRAWTIGQLVNTYATVTLDMGRVNAGVGGPRPVRTYPGWIDDWPQDACDAYCIALATRTLLQHDEKAA